MTSPSDWQPPRGNYLLLYGDSTATTWMSTWDTARGGSGPYELIRDHHSCPVPRTLHVASRSYGYDGGGLTEVPSLGYILDEGVSGSLFVAEVAWQAGVDRAPLRVGLGPGSTLQIPPSKSLTVRIYAPVDGGWKVVREGQPADIRGEYAAITASIVRCDGYPAGVRRARLTTVVSPGVTYGSAADREIPPYAVDLTVGGVALGDDLNLVDPVVSWLFVSGTTVRTLGITDMRAGVPHAIPSMATHVRVEVSGYRAADTGGCRVPLTWGLEY